MRPDYIGKDVYIGIDVHKKSYSIYCIVDREKVKSWTMNASPSELIKKLHDYFPESRIHTVYEAGFSGFALHRVLVLAGIKNRVVNPGSVETASRDRVKTDKRDAKKLSEQLSHGRLKSIYIPTEEEELVRLSIRLRGLIVKNRARVACQIKSKLYQFGYDETLSDDKAATSKWVVRIQSATHYPAELKEVLDYLCQDWLRLTNDLKELNKKIGAQSKASKKLTIEESVYKSVPGIGIISARELSRELGSLQQFSSNKHLYSFLGLTPSESSSGEQRRQGRISRCGRPRLRHLLTEVAWRSVYKDPELAEQFARLSHRRGKKRAIVAIARMLIGRVRACFTQGQFYQQQPLKEATH